MRSMTTPQAGAQQPEDGKKGWRRKKPARSEGPEKAARPRRRWKKKAVVCAIAAVLLAGSASGLYLLFGAEEERVPVTGTLTYGALNEAIEGSGTTIPADSVTYEISGTVLEWNLSLIHISEPTRH